MLLNNWGIGSFRLVPTRRARPSALGVQVMEPTHPAQSAQTASEREWLKLLPTPH